MNLFSYSTKRSCLHSINPLVKFFLVILLTYAIFHLNVSTLFLIFFVFNCCFLFFGIKNYSQVLKFGSFIFFLSSIFIIISQLKTGFILDDFRAPAIYTMELVCILFVSIFFVFSTKPMDIAKSISKLFFWNKKISFNIFLLIFLVFSFIPILNEKMRQINNAQKSRAQIKNPLKKVVFITFPLLIISFEIAYRLSLALESRLHFKT